MLTWQVSGIPLAALGGLKGNMMRLSRRTLLQVSGASIALSSSVAHAQSYPNRQIKFILAEAAGSSNDVVARIIAQPISSILGQSVIVENRPGGGTLIGVRAVVEAPPDGYTLLVSSSSALITTALLNKNDTYDLNRDLTPIAGVASTSWVLVINPDVPAKSLQELVSFAKANPGKLNIGFAQGTGPQMVAESFKTIAGLDIVGIPYTGGARVVTDLLGGSLQLYFGSAATTLSFVKSGALQALVVTGEERDPLLPDLPTMTEAGFPSLTLASALGIFGPAHMPAQIADDIYRGVTECVRSPALAAQIRSVGYTPAVMPAQGYADLLRHYQDIWTPIARDIERGEKVTSHRGCELSHRRRAHPIGAAPKQWRLRTLGRYTAPSRPLRIIGASDTALSDPGGHSSPRADIP